MIVDRDTLDVRPITDKVIHEIAGEYVNEIERGAISWSNELVLHVIELKTNGPAKSLNKLHLKFQEQVNEINRLLETHNARLMSTAMHPWMDPYKEMKLWPHEYNPIYETYNRIFDCRGHGWANLQSTHINLPFSNDDEFEKLHAAIRVLLPILPGLAASSPVADLQRKPHRDFRLEVYRTNSPQIPSVTGHIVPEPIFSHQKYDEVILQRMYKDIAPHDPEKILQDEWLNSRGAIARFNRGSIEIRVLDIQECPLADMAVIRITIDTLKALVSQQWSSLEDQKKWDERSLYNILLKVMKDAEETVFENVEYAGLFNFYSGKTVGALWRYLFDELYDKGNISEDPVLQCLDVMLDHGTLASRILNKLPEPFSGEQVFGVYNSLCECLSGGTLFGINE